MKIAKALVAILLVCSLFAGCASENGEKASVQAVSMICGAGNVGMQNRYAGMVSARGEVNIEKDENREVTEILVHEGDTVKAGQVLFTYDTEQASLLVERAELEVEQMKAGITDKKNARDQLEKEKKKAGTDEQLSYTLEIQACDADIREAEYNLKLKEKEVERQKEAFESTEVVSPVDGQITSMNTTGDSYDANGQKKPYISLMESGAYRVRGLFNENNAGQIVEGAPVRVLSRVDDSVWTGVISFIDWEHPTSGNSGGVMMYDGAYAEDAAELTSSSSYPFYVEMEESEGLRLGQHVYIEIADGSAAGDPASVYLPAYYLVDITEEGASVWAMNSREKLEKRAVTLGEYESATDAYEIREGLSMEDYIAFPDETLREGMACTTFDESAFEPNTMPEDYPDMDTGSSKEMFPDEEAVLPEEGGALMGEDAVIDESSIAG